MAKVKITGFKELEKTFKKMERNIDEFNDKKTVSMSELFDGGFLSAHSSFKTFDEMMTASGFKCESQEDFNAIPEDQFDAFISANTTFQSWNDMKSSAATALVKRKLFQGL